MGLWSNNVNTEIRARFGDLIVKNPNTQQKTEIMEIINKDTTLEEEGYKTNIDMMAIRYLLKNLTNIDYEEELSNKTDKELNEDINNSNLDLKQLLNSIREIINELVYDVHVANLASMDNMGQYIQLMQGDSKMETIANKLGVSTETLVGISKQDPVALEELQLAMNKKGKGKEVKNKPKPKSTSKKNKDA